MMNITLNQMRIFLEIVNQKSITKASEYLNMTQPAVSIQLKNLQDQFEQPLTETIGRQIYITSFGLEIAENMALIFDKIELIHQKTHSKSGQLIGKLKIAVVSTGKYVMPYFLNDFLKSHPSVELQMDVTNRKKVLRSLENNEIDFALVSILPEKLKVQKIDLMPNKLFLVDKKDENSAEVNHFRDKSFLFRENGSGTRFVMEKYLKKHKIETTKKMELTSNEAVKQAVLAGLGYSIMPIIGLKNEIQSNELQLVSQAGLPIQTTWSLVWLSEKKLNKVSLAYLEFLENTKSQIVQTHFSWTEKYEV